MKMRIFFTNLDILAKIFSQIKDFYLNFWLNFRQVPTWKVKIFSNFGQLFQNKIL